jgi:protein-L-isoaspartate(D-aspartate) O-methyltransferase
MTFTVALPMSAVDLHAKARFNMVESQIRTNRVTDDRLLSALFEVPRQIFVPEALASVAYVDSSIRIAKDRYLVEPLVLARLLQEAMVGEGDKVLVVGAGTGYSAAILGGLCASVTAVESDATLAAAARKNLAALAVTNVTVHEGALEQGWPASAPYDVILIDGMVADLPSGLTAQLADHGRLVTIRSQEGRSGAGMLYRKLGGAVSGRPLFDAVVPYLPGFAPRPEFAF